MLPNEKREQLVHEITTKYACNTFGGFQLYLSKTLLTTQHLQHELIFEAKF